MSHNHQSFVRAFVGEHNSRALNKCCSVLIAIYCSFVIGKHHQSGKIAARAEKLKVTMVELCCVSVCGVDRGSGWMAMIAIIMPYLFV